MSKTFTGGGAVLATILAVIALFVIVTLLVTWPAMIMFGVVHSYWAWLPAFGFWETLGVVVLARLVSPTASVNSKS
jgi:hypothetical protein